MSKATDLPVQLTGLIAKEDINSAAGAEVLPDNGDLGAPRLGSSAWGQCQHRRGLGGTAIHECFIQHWSNQE